ncbi:hypothetical protein Gotur_032460, partial [Gossypium turneri]
MTHSRGVFPVHATVALALRLSHQTILIFSGGGESKSLQKRREEKEQLHGDENVLFAGYKLPHPLQYKILVRIHTTSQSSPMQAYNQAINDLDKELDHLKSAFEVTFVFLHNLLVLLSVKFRLHWGNCFCIRLQ